MPTGSGGAFRLDALERGELEYGSFPVPVTFTPGTYNSASLVVGADGRITSIAGGVATPTVVTTNGTVVNAGSAQAQPKLTIAGVTTSSVAIWSLPNAPDATWQTGIGVLTVCTTNAVTLYLINPTAGNITPVTQAVNVRVLF